MRSSSRRRICICCKPTRSRAGSSTVSTTVLPSRAGRPQSRPSRGDCGSARIILSSKARPGSRARSPRFVRRTRRSSTACRMRPCSPLGFCPYLVSVRNPVAFPRALPVLQHRSTFFLAAFLALGLPLAAAQAQTDLAGLTQRADGGDPDAQNTLGNAYANGQGAPQDLALARKYYSLAAAMGYAPAQFNLGMMAELGRGQAPDLTAAFSYYLKAAGQNFAPAQFNVGNMYANGIGVARDYLEAALWFRQAADRGIPEAQYNLALAYELGRGILKDEAQAQKWYRLAADKGYARARYNLALMLEEGRGSAADERTAAQLYRLAAQQGFGPAQNNYGIMLAEGRGGLASNL